LYDSENKTNSRKQHGSKYLTREVKYSTPKNKQHLLQKKHIGTNCYIYRRTIIIIVIIITNTKCFSHKSW